MRPSGRGGNFGTGLASCTAANRAKYCLSTPVYRRRGCNFGIILVLPLRHATDKKILHVIEGCPAMRWEMVDGMAATEHSTWTVLPQL